MNTLEKLSTKRCRRCRRERPTTEFSKNGAFVDGSESRCRDCINADSRARYQRQAKANLVLVIDTAAEKRCTGCNALKPASEFHRRLNRSGGLADRCKACSREYNRRNYARLCARPKVKVTRKQCRRCKLTKPASEFHLSKRYPDGLELHCKACFAIRHADRNWGLRAYFRRFIWNAKTRRSGELSPDDLIDVWNKQGGLCRLTGTSMTHKCSPHGSATFYTNVSVDRIDNSKGYEIGNIQLVCNWANRAKHCLSDAEFITFCRMVAEHKG